MFIGVLRGIIVSFSEEPGKEGDPTNDLRPGSAGWGASEDSN